MIICGNQFFVYCFLLCCLCCRIIVELFTNKNQAYNTINMAGQDGEFQPYITTEYDPIKVASIDGTDTRPHDRAVLRALRAGYRPGPAAARADPRRCVFVARLHPKTTQESVVAEFAPCGPVERCALARDAVTGRSRRYAFVQFESAAAAARALALHGSVVEGATLVVQACVAQLPGWAPRRLGGGLGGARAAGQLRFGGRARPFQPPIRLHPAHPAHPDGDASRPHRPVNPF